MIEITSGMTGRQFLFKIQGYSHGQPIFTDQIHYLLKGGKLMKCALQTINNYKYLAWQTHDAQNAIKNRTNKFNRHYSKEMLANYTLDFKHKRRDKKLVSREIPLFDHCGKRLNYLGRRSFVVRVTDLPKQFGFELAMG